MDNASDYGSEDSRFDSWLAQKILKCRKTYAGLLFQRISCTTPNRGRNKEFYGVISFYFTFSFALDLYMTLVDVLEVC